MQSESAKSFQEISIQCLVIESDQDTIALLKERLDEWFDRNTFKVHLASDLPTAEKALRSNRYDLIISDVRFPGEIRKPNQVIKFLRALPGVEEVTLIILSELPGPGMQVESLLAGADEYFTTDIKTIPPAVVKHRIQRIVHQIKRHKLIHSRLDSPATLDAKERTIGDGNSIEEISKVGALQEQLVDLELKYENLMRTQKELEAESNRLMRAFSMYVDPAIIQNIVLGDPMHWQKGTRKNITVLFSDLRGYTRMSSKMSSENVISFLNEYFTAMTEVIMGYNGMIDKYMGDGIMCLFGAPVDNPDHSSNAIEAAIEMQNVFELWLPNWEKNYDIKPAQGIGLASGDAVVGNLGGFQKVSYTAIGSVVNLASRLEGLAGPGDICISAELYKNLSQEFLQQYSFEPLTPIPIKGLDGRHHVYRLTGEIDLDDILVQT